jgi:hypothetical protein
MSAFDPKWIITAVRSDVEPGDEQTILLLKGFCGGYNSDTGDTTEPFVYRNSSSLGICMLRLHWSAIAGCSHPCGTIRARRIARPDTGCHNPPAINQ